MFKSPYFILFIALALIVALFLLPKVVVNNEEKQLSEEEHSPDDGHDHGPDESPATAVHSATLSASDEENIKVLRENIFNSVNKEKSATFADSLATLFRSMSRYDSAAKYVEHIATLQPGQQTWLRAGNSYYDAFSFAVDQKKLTYLGEKAREYYSRALEVNPALLEAKSNMAMTYLSTDNPMQGIALLREVLVTDPNNEQALFNLGILSIQSGQYDLAIERFEKLVELYPNNLQAQFYLGVGYFEGGKKAKARKQFEKVKLTDADPAVQAAIEGYMEEL